MLQMTKKAIEKLIQETNHILTLDDFDLVEQLDGIAKSLQGTTRTERRLLNQPFELSRVLFYPLTVAKSLWYTEKVVEWDLTETAQEGLLFWLLTLPNTDTALDPFSDQKAADKAVRRLVRRLHCTPAEMNAVYAKCVGNEGSDSGDDGEAVDYGGMVSVLIREYGGTPDQWLYETPIEKISDLFRVFTERAMAESEHQSHSTSGKAVAPPPSARLKALAMFRRKVTEIKGIWNGE